MRLNAGRIMERSRSRTKAETSSHDLFGSVPGECLTPYMEPKVKLRPCRRFAGCMR